MPGDARREAGRILHLVESGRIKRSMEGPLDMSHEGRLLPTVTETLDQYNFLKSASLSRLSRKASKSSGP